MVKILSSIDGDTGQFPQQELIAVAGLYICTDTQKMSLQSFAPEKMSVSVYMTETFI